MVAPSPCSSSGETDFTEPWVPTGMKQGVRTTPCGVVNVPARAEPWVPSRVKSNIAFRVTVVRLVGQLVDWIRHGAYWPIVPSLTGVAPMASAQRGFLLIADISGYTTY